MTKGVITANFGSGQYGVRLEYGSADLDAEIAALGTRIIELTQYVLDAKVGLIDLDTLVNEIADDIDDVILSYGGAVPDAAEVVELIKSASRAAALRQAQAFRVDRLIAKKLGLAARKTMLENAKLTLASLELTESVIYCADYTDGMAVDTEVGVAVVPGEFSSASLTILPQARDLSGYDRERDGQLTPALSMSPEAVFYNWAMFPGWQRWMPTYRHGVITAFSSNNGCTVRLDDASSSEANPDGVHFTVNLAESTSTILEDVPIEYMNCNSAAFAINDHVIVRFDGVVSANAGAANWENPRVVGFVREPKQCPALPPVPAEPERRNLIGYDFLFNGIITNNTYISTDSTYAASWDESFSGEETMDLWMAGPPVTFTAYGTGSVSDSAETYMDGEFAYYRRTLSESRNVSIVGNYGAIGNITVFEHSFSREYDIDTGPSVERADRNISVTIINRHPIWICATGNSYMEIVIELTGDFVWGWGDPSANGNRPWTQTLNVYHSGSLVTSQVIEYPNFGWVDELSPFAGVLGYYKDYGGTVHLDCVKRVTAGPVETDAIPGCNNTDTDDYDSPLVDTILSTLDGLRNNPWKWIYDESINTG